jgi:DNA-binding beta-propeller fold protein YncE
MTYLEQQPPYPDRDRRRRLALLGALFALFLAALGVFTLLIRQGAPRAGLPDVLGASSKGKPTFERTLAAAGRPWGVAVSPDGKRLYVSEGAGAYAVKVFDNKGSSIADATPPNTNEYGRLPMGLAVAPSGLVYVADRKLRQVDVYDADGAFKDVLRPAGVDDWAPTGIAVDSSGLIYVSEAYELPVADGQPGIERHRIYELQPDGAIVRTFGEKGGTESTLMYPNQLAVDGKDRVWVADTAGVKVFQQDGTFLFRLRGEGDDGVTLPGGVAYGDGKIFVTDVTNHRVLVFDASADAPKFVTQFGDLGFGKGQFRYPAGIAVSGSRIYIANRENGRIDTWTQ